MIDRSRFQEYPNLMEYYDHYVKTDGAPEHKGCFPNLIIWIREALGENQYDVIDLFNMTKEDEEEFCSWGHNSRWNHVFAPMIYQFLIEDDEDLHDWCVGVILGIAEEYGDPDVEKKYFTEKDKQDD